MRGDAIPPLATSAPERSSNSGNTKHWQLNRGVYQTGARPYHGGDAQEVKAFLERWATQENVFTPRILGEDVYAREGLVDSGNTDYVIGQIRRRYIADAS